MNKQKKINKEANRKLNKENLIKKTSLILQPISVFSKHTIKGINPMLVSIYKVLLYFLEINMSNPKFNINNVELN